MHRRKIYRDHRHQKDVMIGRGKEKEKASSRDMRIWIEMKQDMEATTGTGQEITVRIPARGMEIGNTSE